MDTLAFLSLIWPNTGPYLLAIPAQFTKDGKTHQYFKHFGHASIASAAAHAQSLATGSGEDINATDVYFAVASVKEDLTPLRSKDLDAVGKKVRGIHKRTKHDNTRAAKCFWIDIDVKAGEANAYATRADAVTALNEFVTACTLPAPYVVASGGGYHVYWPMDEAIDADKWYHYASILKQLCKSRGLRADPSRTADRASVLRPVGTYNWKTGQPRLVELKQSGVLSTTNHLLSKLAYLAETAGFNTPAPAPSTGIAHLGPMPSGITADARALNEQQAASVVTQGPPANAKRVVQRCQQLSWQAANQPQVLEPQWYDMVGCLRHAERGDDAVHRMSVRHPSYSQTDTDAKIAQHIAGDYGPTLCQTFEDHRPGGCAGCPHSGKIKTPLQLGKQELSAPTPTATIETAAGVTDIELPDAPFPFRRVVDARTGQAKIAIRQYDKDDQEIEDDIIYDNDIYPSRLVFNERENAYYCAVRRFLPKDGWADFEFRLGQLYDRRSLASLLGNIGVVPDLGKVELLVQYMIAYIRDLQKHAAASIVYAQLGWRDDRRAFVLPETLVTTSGQESLRISKNVVDTLTWKEPRGDLDTWKQVANVFDNPGMAPHQFGFGVGFAAPLFKFTNFNGMIIAMVGERGSGKSSSALAANSIWGHPTMGWGDMENDTRRAFYEKLGVLQHLPVTYDEITNLDPDTLSDLCYAVSKGQGRRRLNTDGTSKENFGSWQTMMLTTSNSSLHARLQMAKADASAESVRVFEYTVPPNTLAKDQADAAFGLLKDHYGLAGPVYAAFLVKHADKVAARVQHWVREIDRNAQVTSGERFWSAGPACVLTGFEIANRCGLTNANIDRLYQFSLDTIIQMRSTVDDGIRTPMGVLSDYLNGNLRNTLVANSKPERGKVMLIGREPTGELRVRFDTWDNRLYIDRRHMRQFCADRKIDFNMIRNGLLNLGVMLNDQRKVVLGQGTSFGTAQTRCWTIDTSHQYMAGTVPVLATGAIPAAVDGGV